MKMGNLTKEIGFEANGMVRSVFPSRIKHHSHEILAIITLIRVFIHILMDPSTKAIGRMTKSTAKELAAIPMEIGSKDCGLTGK